MDTLKKVMEINTWFLLLHKGTKKYLKNTQNFGVKLKIKLKQLMVVNQLSIKKISWKLSLNQMIIYPLVKY